MVARERSSGAPQPARRRATQRDEKTPIAAILDPLRLNRRTRRDRSSELEASVLDAAEQLLETVPLYELEVKQIIEAAGISRTAFYVYFSSKFAVVAALLARSFEEIAEVSQEWTAGDDGPPTERLRRSLEATGEVWERHRAVFAAASEQWHADPDLEMVYLAILDHFVGLFQTVVERDIELGHARATEDLESLMTTLVWSTERVLYLATTGSNPVIPDVPSAITAVYRLWAGTLYGEQAPPARPRRRK